MRWPFINKRRNAEVKRDLQNLARTGKPEGNKRSKPSKPAPEDVHPKAVSNDKINFHGLDLTMHSGRRSRRAIGMKERPRLPKVTTPRTHAGYALTTHVNINGEHKPLPRLTQREPIGKRIIGGVLSSLKWLFIVKPKFLIIERYIWLECITNFLLGTMGFTFFMIITSIFGLGEKIFSKDIPPFTIAKVLILSAPMFLVLAIPVAVVFSTLMAMGRFNRDNEIVAFTTNGISLYRVFIPFLAMAMFGAFCTWMTYETIVPPNSKEYKEVLKVFWRSQVVDFIKPGIVIKAPDHKYFHVDEIRKERIEDDDGSVHYQSFMYKIRLYDYFRGAESSSLRNFPRMFIAEKAWVDDQFLVLDDVSLYNLDSNKGDSLVGAKMPQVKIDIGTKINDYILDPHPTELKAEDLRNRIAQIRDRLVSSTFPSPTLKRKYYLNSTEYYFKFAIPFACIALCMVAVPVSLTGPRDERNMGILISFGLIMVYYIIFFVCRTLGSRGIELAQEWNVLGHTIISKGTNVFPPQLAGWLPCATFLIAAGLLFWRARK